MGTAMLSGGKPAGYHGRSMATSALVGHEI